MRRIIFFLVFLYSYSFALKDEWMAKIEDSSVTLNNGDEETVILKKDPSKGGNIFGQGQRQNFDYLTTYGSSKLILEKDPNTLSSSQGSDMSYYIEGDIFINPGSHLIMNLDSTGSKGLFKLDGGAIKVYNSSLEINDVNNFVIDTTQGGGGITVSNGSTLYK